MFRYSLALLLCLILSALAQPSAVSQVTAVVPPSLEVTSLVNPVVVIDPSGEEAGVWSDFEVRGNVSSVTVSCLVTVLSSGAVTFPVNQPRGVNVEPDDSSPVPPYVTLQYYVSDEAYGGLPGYRTGEATYATDDGLPLTRDDVGRLFRVNPGWETVADPPSGEYTGWIVMTVSVAI